VASSEAGTSEHLAYRQRCLLLWLRAVVGHPLLKRSPFLFLFLTSYDECVAGCGGGGRGCSRRPCCLLSGFRGVAVSNKRWDVSPLCVCVRVCTCVGASKWQRSPASEPTPCLAPSRTPLSTAGPQPSST
jgi:hypothetical protein